MKTVCLENKIQSGKKDDCDNVLKDRGANVSLGYSLM